MSNLEYENFLIMYGLTDVKDVYTFVKNICCPNVSLHSLQILWTLMHWKHELEKHKDNNVLVYTVKQMIGGLRVKNDFILIRLTRLLRSFAMRIRFTLPTKYLYRYLDQLAQKQTATFSYILIMCFPLTVDLPHMLFEDDPILFENTLKDPDSNNLYISKLCQWIEGKS